MKKPNLFLASLLIGGYLHAQNPKIEQSQWAAYFEANKSSISEADSIQLEQLAQTLKAHKNYEISLQAYTDDRGSDKKNKKLAAQRSEAVLQFLKRRNVPTASQQVLDNVGEIALQNGADLEAQRAKNRRVDIQVTTIKINDLKDLYNYLSSQNRSSFLLDNSRDTFIIGKKGSSFFIEKNSFMLADGSGAEVKQPVKFELQEAYQYGDMLGQNLATISDEQLLQTGGMVHLAATDAEGRELLINPKTPLDMKMPTAVGNKDMNLFVSERPLDQPSVGMTWEMKPRKFEVITVDRPKQLTMMDYLNFPDREQMPRFPSLQKVPVKPIKPSLELVAATAPDMDIIKSKIQPKKNEADSSYQKRVEKELEKQTQNYQRALAANAQIKSKYEQDLLAYEQKMQQFEAAKTAYGQYQNDIRGFIKQHNELKVDRMINQWFNTVQIASEYEQLHNLLIRLQAECLRFNLGKKHQELAGYISQLNELNINFRGMRKLRAQLTNAGKTACNWQVAKNKEQLYLFSTDFPLSKADSLPFQDLDNLDTAAASAERAAEFYYRSYYQKLEQDATWEQLAMLNKIIENSNLVQNKQLLQQINERAQAIFDDILKCKIAAKDPSVYTERSFTDYQIDVTGMGWINCDRFLSVPDYAKCPLITEELRKDSIQSQQVFCIMPQAKAICPLMNTIKDKRLRVQMTVPKTEQTVLVGIEVRDEQIYLAKVSDTAEKLNGVKLEYKPVNVSELKNALADLR